MSYDDLQLNVPYFVQYDNPNEWFVNIYTSRNERMIKGSCVNAYNCIYIDDDIATNLGHWQSVTVCKPLSGPIDALQENYPELFL